MKHLNCCKSCYAFCPDLVPDYPCSDGLGWDVGIEISPDEVPFCYKAAVSPEAMLTPEFSAAMHTHMDYVKAHGHDSDEARLSFVRAMRLAPPAFLDSVIADMPDLLPVLKKCFDDGTPAYGLEEIAAHVGISLEDATKNLEQMLEEFPDMAGVTDPARTHSLN